MPKGERPYRPRARLTRTEIIRLLERKGVTEIEGNPRPRRRRLVETCDEGRRKEAKQPNGSRHISLGSRYVGYSGGLTSML